MKSRRSDCLTVPPRRAQGYAAHVPAFKRGLRETGHVEYRRSIQEAVDLPSPHPEFTSVRCALDIGDDPGLLERRGAQFEQKVDRIPM